MKFLFGLCAALSLVCFGLAVFCIVFLCHPFDDSSIAVVVACLVAFLVNGGVLAYHAYTFYEYEF